MDYAALITATESALLPLAEATDGSVVVAETLEQARTFLMAAPSRWRIILHWEGHGDHEAARAGMTYHQVATVVQAPRGLALRPDPTKQRATGTPSFAARLAAVTGWMTAMRFPNGTGADSAGFALAGSQWLETVPNYAAHALNWRLAAALPGYPATIVLQFPHLSTPPPPTP